MTRPPPLARAARALLLAAALLGPGVPAFVLAQGIPTEAERALERRVKAAFLFRFTEYVTWPDSAFARPESPFVIAVAGREAMVEELRQITAGRSVAGRSVEVRRALDNDAAGAHLVFVSDAERARLRDWMRTAPRHALVVTESDGALVAGSVINFLIVEGRVRFEISLDSAERRGLRMSSRLLTVAQSVRAGIP